MGGWSCERISLECSRLAVQGDYKIIAVGCSNWYTETGGAPRFALVRYEPNAGLDTSFGAGGKVQTRFPHLTEWATSVAIQSNGRIVAGGRSDVGGPSFALARYRRGRS